jgi:hypothetical protein
LHLCCHGEATPAQTRFSTITGWTSHIPSSFYGTIALQAELFGTVPDDVSIDGYERHLESEAAPAPLSMEEMEKEEIKMREVGVDVGSSTRKAMVATGIAFPVDDSGMAQYVPPRVMPPSSEHYRARSMLK